MKFRSKAAPESHEWHSKKEFPFHNFKIPNDDDIARPKKLKRKGMQIKKYSDYFMFATGKALLSAIISFAEKQGLCYTEDSSCSAVLLESHTDDVNVSIKANIVDNPSSQSQCIECIKLSGEKTPFMKLFHQLCQHCMSVNPSQME